MSQTDGNRELALSLKLDAPRDKIWRCWTEADLLKQWFAPAPWTVPFADLDVRPGGRNRITMRSPEGDDMPNAGVYLDVVPNEKLVVTDAYTDAWVPSPKPFMTAILMLEDAGQNKTSYTAIARHWTADDCRQHQEMGFQEGWTTCARQLEAVARDL